MKDRPIQGDLAPIFDIEGKLEESVSNQLDIELHVINQKKDKMISVLISRINL